MNIKIHRGLDQIGGCITEISTETSRVFIDFGQNLPGNGVPTTPEEDEALVTQIFAQNKRLQYSSSLEILVLKFLQEKQLWNIA